MTNFLIGFGVCVACFVTGLLTADKVKGWLVAAVSAVKAKV